MGFVSITFDNIKTEIERFLRVTYNKADQLYSNASPFGQLLNVTQEMHNLSFLYLKNSLRQFDLSTSTNKNVIRSAAVVAGHNPGRHISATGLLKFNLNTTSDITTDIPGSQITISNKSAIRNKSNGLEYLIDLGGKDSITYTITNNTEIIFNIIQGIRRIETRTGNGLPNQTYSINVGGGKDIEQFNTNVYVNGDRWEVKNHLYEMISNEQAVVVRTGYSGGIDIIFGNSAFGEIPELASVIDIEFIESVGSDGNIFRRTTNDWTLIDSIIDGFGNTIDIENIFDISILTDINFGADKESIEFTRNILPLTSNNFVLALPKQYAYQIKRLGVFSHVNAYEESGTVMIVATPNIKLFKNQSSNYFTINKEAFFLDTYEKSKIDRYLKSGGNIQLTKKYRITGPVLSYYVLNLFIQVYDDTMIDSVKLEIEDKVSEYFLNFDRTDRVPKADIINIISELDDIDSVDVNFVSKKNEDYHRRFIQKNKNIRNTTLSNGDSLSIEREFPDYNPNQILGLDPILGDIIFEPKELPIIRGGWKDRNDLMYDEDNDSQLSSINIVVKGRSNKINRNRI